MIFYKTVTAGNDFIHIDEGEYRRCAASLSKGELAKRICRRHAGAGADGVVYYTPEPGPRGFGFEIFNRDGSGAELSGNGMAGLTSLLVYLGKASSGKVGTKIPLDTGTGPRTHIYRGREGNRVRLDIEIGEPDFGAHHFFPFLHGSERHEEYDGIEFYPVSTGNPHVVVFLNEAPPQRELERRGRYLSNAPIFPHRTNVEFVMPFGNGKADYDRGRNFDVYFYERGVGPTLASSTGSAAIYAVLRKLKRLRYRLLLPDPHHLGEIIKISGKTGIRIENCTEIVYKGRYLMEST